MPTTYADRTEHQPGFARTATGPAENIVLQAPRLVRTVGAFGGMLGLTGALAAGPA
jgi:hypothetical protein